MGSFNMEATQINYRRDETVKTVDQKLQELSHESAIDTDIAPVFKSTSSYEVGDLVYYRNKLYTCTTPHSGAWVAADFTATDVTTSIKSAAAVKADEADIAPAFDATASYAVGDLVYYVGIIYRCTNAHEGDWDADDFSATTISGELNVINSNLTSKQDATDNNLQTTDKTVVGGINEVNTLANAINARTFAYNTPVFFAPNWRGGQSYNDIVLNKLEKLRCGFLLTKSGIFPFQTNTNGDGFIVDSGVNLTITNEGNNTYRFACAGEWYTTCLFMFLWDYR